MLKIKIQLSNFEDLAGSIQQFANWAASHLANREELQELYKMETLFQAEGGRNKERRDHLIFLWGIGRVSVADNLIGADQKIIDCLVKTTFLEKVETGDLGLA